MKPVFQQVTHHSPEQNRYGDCLRACIASLFEFDIENVPHFCDEYIYPEGFITVLREWLAQRDLTYATFPVPAESLEEFKASLRSTGMSAYHLMGGLSGTAQHVVVARFGEVVHDPWPKIDNPFYGHLSPDADGKYEFWLFVKCFRD